jgi:hypothetical protein
LAASIESIKSLLWFIPASIWPIDPHPQVIFTL